MTQYIKTKETMKEKYYCTIEKYHYRTFNELKSGRVTVHTHIHTHIHRYIPYIHTCRFYNIILGEVHDTGPLSPISHCMSKI